MIHRNTMIATPDTLLLADNTSCKLLDGATGAVKGEIIVPGSITDGPVWKWMALAHGTLYALVGEQEPPGDTLKGEAFRGAGWPWWKIPNYRWGFGRTIVAIDPSTKKVLWHHRELEPLDTRAMCMRGDRIYFYSHQNFLGCLNAKTGKVVWKTNSAAVLDAIGEHHTAQFARRGFLSSAYAKCSDDAIYFAGPQRTKLVAVSADDGELLWQFPEGNYQLVLREDALYAMGSTHPSQKFHPITGKALRTLPNRAACTRATGSIDRVFVRGGGTRAWDVAAERWLHISPMRPACHDGVVITGGHLYWGPWMCGCNLSLLGIICLGPAGDFNYAMKATEAERLQRNHADVRGLDQTAYDWPTYRRDNTRSARSHRPISRAPTRLWTYKHPTETIPTAPVAVGGLVFLGNADGTVRALNAETGKTEWTALTGGMVMFPPSIEGGRALVGSADGWVYAFDAATGRQLWRFRAAPVERKIPVYGSLSSTWPVGSGVLVEKGIAYAACGMANYDGTHVYALNAATGELRWQNNTSGNTAGGQGAGASVQGHLMLHKDRLYMAGGNRVPVASYDLADGTFQPVRGGRVTRSRGPAGKDLFLRTNGTVAATGNFPLYARPEDFHYIEHVGLSCGLGGALLVQTNTIAAYEPGASRGARPRRIWSRRPFNENVAVAVTPNAVVVAGTNRRFARPGASPTETYGIVAMGLENGAAIWRHPLTAAPTAWGIAVERSGRLVVTLRDGSAVCFGSKE
jgi:outer membrane protein assembly factor BamB